MQSANMRCTETGQLPNTERLCYDTEQICRRRRRHRNWTDYVVSEIIKDKKEDKRVVKRTPIPGVYDPKPRKHLKLPMPKTCRRRIHLRNAKSIRAMSQRCLLNHSYYISETGAVTHPRYPSRYAYPNLIR